MTLAMLRCAPTVVVLLLAVLSCVAAAPLRGSSNAAAAPLVPSPSSFSTSRSNAHLPFRAVDAAASVAGARDLIRRHYPERVDSFNLSIVSKESPTAEDFFVLSSSPAAAGVVSIAGTSAVMLTAGFNHYLSYVLNVQLLTWSTSTPPLLPAKLPSLPAAVTVHFPYLLRYYYNICTLSYSTQWWSWQQWEREVDWMALRGINFPLALNGQEIVWYDVYSQLGLNDTEILDFIAGPAFLAWQRMGNIQGWGGPMTQSWMRQQAELQTRLLARMRQLDMYPVLAAFDGYVPVAMKTHYPDANIAPSAGWSDFPAQYQNDDLLDPSDPLFQRIGSLYVTAQTQRFGTDHFYNSDTYNENSPSTNDTLYLANVSAAVFSAMKAADPDAVWVMQGWVFINDQGFWQPAQVQAYLGSVPNERMIILDLMSDVAPVFPRTQDYYGKRFVWNMLHNFGGNNGMMGMIDVIASRPALDKQRVGDALVGIGATPEGIFQNEIVYDLLYDMGHRAEPVNVSHWVQRYVTRRFGIPQDAVTAFQPLYDAYAVLASSVYNCTAGNWGVTKSFLELTPGLQMNSTGFMPTEIWYDNGLLGSALEMTLQAAAERQQLDRTGQERLAYDLVDFGKQWMSNILISLHAALVAAYEAKDVSALQTVGGRILELIADWDSLLATNDRFLLGNWIEDARRWGTTVDEQDGLEFNARNQVTLWGPTGQIADYASKQWSGLITGYYLPRWQLFITTLADAVKAGQQWDADAYGVAKRVVEEAWQTSREKYPTTTSGDTVQYAQYVYDKYSQKQQQQQLVSSA